MRFSPLFTSTFAVLAAASGISGSEWVFGLQEKTEAPQTAAIFPDPGQQMNILAVVNGQQIVRDEIAHACLVRFGESVLKSMLNKRLVFSECIAQGIQITEKDVNDEIARQAAKFNMSAKQYTDYLCSQRKLSIEQFKNDFIWQEMALRQLAAREIQVEPDELQKQMEFEFGPKVQVREIVSNTREDAEQVLAEVHQNPDSFGQIAKLRSVNPNSAAVKGLLPPLALHSASPELEKIVFSMQPGQISDIIEAQGQFLIIRCERIFPAVQVSQEDMIAVQDRLIEQLSEQKLADAAVALFERLQAKSEVINVHNDPELSKQFPGVAARVNGVDIMLKDLAEECISRFGHAMLNAEINRKILQQALLAAGVQVTSDDLSREVNTAAEADGFINQDGSVNPDAWLVNMTGNDLSLTDSLIADTIWPTCALRKLVESSITVTEEDMEKGFEANYGPRVEALMIVLRDQRQAMKVWQMASTNLRESGEVSEEFFGQLANQYSIEEASRANFGQIPPIQRFGGRPELENEAFSLEKGEISQVVQVGNSYVILLCTGRTEPVVTNPADVEDRLRDFIRQQKTSVAMAQKGRSLHAAAQIDNFLEGTSQPGEKMVQAARNGLEGVQR